MTVTTCGRACLLAAFIHSACVRWDVPTAVGYFFHSCWLQSSAVCGDRNSKMQAVGSSTDTVNCIWPETLAAPQFCFFSCGFFCFNHLPAEESMLKCGFTQDLKLVVILLFSENIVLFSTLYKIYYMTDMTCRHRPEFMLLRPLELQYFLVLKYFLSYYLHFVTDLHEAKHLPK